LCRNAVLSNAQQAACPPARLNRAVQVLVVQWWSFDQAAKINEKSMKNQ